jgi:hypothetical protein
LENPSRLNFSPDNNKEAVAATRLEKMKIRPAPLHIQRLIEDVMKNHLDGHNIQAKNIRVETEVDGSQMVCVDMHYEYSTRPINPRSTINMLTALNDALSEQDDERFVYVENYFDERQKIADVQRTSTARRAP